MKLAKTDISGVFCIHGMRQDDLRGSFLKTFNSDFYSNNNLNYIWEEDFFSISKKGTIRGLHFQTPPHEQEKLVVCLQGAVIDVLCDIRKNSLTYGQVLSIRLDATESKAIYIPKGIAHGFLALQNETILNYKVSRVYKKEADQGILWNSINFKWPITDPIISQRDMNFISFSNFKSPFIL